MLSQPLASPNMLYGYDCVCCLPAKSVARRSQEQCSGWLQAGSQVSPQGLLGGWRGHTCFSADSGLCLHQACGPGRSEPSQWFLGVWVESPLPSCFPNEETEAQRGEVTAQGCPAPGHKSVDSDPRRRPVTAPLSLLLPSSPGSRQSFNSRQRISEVYGTGT